MNVYELMKVNHENIVADIAAYEKKMALLPRGKIKVKRRGETIRCYHYIDGQDVYLSKKKQTLAEELAQKMYLEKLLQDANAEKNAIEKYLKAHKESSEAQTLLVENPKIEEILRPLFKPLDQKMAAWAQEEYPSTAGFEEERVCQGPGGIMYRSKSESNIAFLLERYRIPFRYENDKEINGITYHIDFTIRHPETRKIIYREHFGKMDDIKYLSKLPAKLKDYESVGIFPDRNLIMTFESQQFPFDIVQAEEIIKRWFL